MTTKVYINNLISEGLTKKEVRESYSSYRSDCELEGSKPATLESYLRQTRRSYKEINISKDMEALSDSNLTDITLKAVDFRRAQQRSQDKSRIEGKIFRETARLTNSLEACYIELMDNIGKLKLPKIPKHKATKSSNWGILNLSDLHFNEEIKNEAFNNSYDFEVASKRLKLFVDTAKIHFKARNVKKVLIAGLGDFLNSDRRDDEKLNESTNRAKATLLGAFLIEHVILDIANDFVTTVAMVTGNESRINKDNEMSKIAATDNFDFMIYEILRKIFTKSPVKFVSPEHIDRELFLDLDGFGLIMVHGEGLKVEKNIRDTFYRYMMNGKTPHYLIHGHFHSTFITDYSSRSGSLCGTNAYAEKQLNLHGRASQNIQIVDKDKTVTPIRIDLQNVEGIEGYEIIPELEAYNAKSHSKINKKTTILKIVRV